MLRQICAMFHSVYFKILLKIRSKTLSLMYEVARVRGWRRRKPRWDRGKAFFDSHLLLSRSSALHEFFIGWLFSAANCSRRFAGRRIDGRHARNFAITNASSGGKVMP